MLGMVGLDYLKGVFKPSEFYDSFKHGKADAIPSTAFTACGLSLCAIQVQKVQLSSEALDLLSICHMACGHIVLSTKVQAVITCGFADFHNDILMIRCLVLRCFLSLKLLLTGCLFKMHISLIMVYQNLNVCEVLSREFLDTSQIAGALPI